MKQTMIHGTGQKPVPLFWGYRGMKGLFDSQAARHEMDPWADSLIAQWAERVGPEALRKEISHLSPQQTWPVSLWPKEWQELLQQPPAPWIDASLLKEANALYQQEQGRIFALLGLYSLPFTYTSATGVEVLGFSRRLEEDAPKRLVETAWFVHKTALWQAREPQRAREVTVRVRLMHALIRYWIGQSGRWDASRLGAPIHQGDMMQTLLSFSAVVLDGLSRWGIRLSARQKQAWMHHWSVLGWDLGISAEYLPMPDTSVQALLESWQERLQDSNPLSVRLTDALVKAMVENSPLRPSEAEVRSSIRFFLGDKAASVLGIGSGSEASTLIWQRNLHRWGLRLPELFPFP